MRIIDFYGELKSNKTITLINVFGYSVALSVCLLIGVFVYNQFSYDRFNDKIDRIYRLNYLDNNKNINHATTNHHWYEVLPEEITGVEKVARYGWSYEQNLEYNENNLKVIGAYADKELFDIFSFNVLEKTEDNFFSNPFSIALSKSLTRKIFGDSSAMGKSIKLNYGRDYTVTAIFENIPENSSIKFDFLINAKDVLDDYGEQMKNHWLWWMWRTFVLVHDNSVIENFGENMKPLQNKYVGEWHATTIDYYLQPLKKIHLHSSSVKGSFYSDFSIVLLYIISSAGILILLISCINYINLSIASFEARKKTVAIKKIIGASRSYLFKHYITYSVILTFLCLALSFVISENFIHLVYSHISIVNGIPYTRIFFWLVIVIFGILIGTLSGLYPANFISKTLTISKSKTIKSQSFFRNGLITFQFTIAIVLLISVVTVKKQLISSTKGDLGYDHSSLICFAGTESTFNSYQVFHEELNKISGVTATTSCNFALPGNLGNFWPVQPEDADSKIEIFHTAVAPDFFDVLSIPVIGVKGQLKEDTASSSNNVVINTEAVRRFGLGDSILDKTYNLGDSKEKVVGISNDFHYGALYDQIKPVQFTITEKCWNYIIRIKKENSVETINQIRNLWNEFEKTRPFDYQYVDDLIASQYSKENTLMKLFNLFFIISMLISIIGLFGVVQLLLKFRIKEIGIRKANGARTREILILFINDFTKWVALAFIIACPVAYYFMNKWLQNFAYRTNLSWWVFAAAGAVAVAVTVFTVSWQSWRAASRNPVEALRYE